MPSIPALDVSVRPIPREIALRYGRLPEYRHIFREIFGREEVLDEGIPTEDMIAQMDRVNVQAALVSGADSRRVNGLHVENDWVADLAKRFPGRIVPGAAVDPLRDVMECVNEITRCSR